MEELDPSSLANPHEVRVEHLDLQLSLDFDRCLVSGSVLLRLRVLREGSAEVHLDSRELSIEKAEVAGQLVPFRVDGPSGPLGSRLRVAVPAAHRSAGSVFELSIAYSTSPAASATQWLPAAATSSRSHPFLFTQCQAIHARSLLPCQDSPGVKQTYSAVVRAPAWCTVLMSGLSEGEPAREGEVSEHRWRQPVPLSSYLIAMAAGALVCQDISDRVRVWAEPAVIGAAVFEFADTEALLRTAESLTCAYLWTRYDLLCLPASFPYG